MYTLYCLEVGGKAFDGKPLPDWKTFSSDDSKKKQADAWRGIARAVVLDLKTFIDLPEEGIIEQHLINQGVVFLQ